MAGLDVLLYAFMGITLVSVAVLAAKFYRSIGLFGGLFGAIFSYICFTSENLILNTVYDQTAQEFVSQTYPMTFFAWIPFVLMVLNFVVAIKK